MRIHRPGLLQAFWTSYPDAEKSLRAWFQEAKAASWKNPAELKAQYRSASILKGGRAVFNICGKKYRLVVQINYEAGIILVRWLGNHAEYDAISAEQI
jgi:mRNA interferase HigB